MKSRVRSALVLLFKLLIVSGVFYWLAQKDLVSLSAFERGWQNKPMIFLGMTSLVVASLLSAIRWQILLRSQNLQLSHPRVLQLHLIGNFFNVALPGAVSGDFVKAFYVARELQGARGQTFGTILFDRIVGVSALVFVSVGALLLDLDRFKGSPVLLGIQTFVMVAGIAVIVFYAYLILMNENSDPILKLLIRFQGRFEKLSSLVRIYQGIRYYHSRKATIAFALFISVLVHLCAGFAMFSFLAALGDDFLELSQVYAVSPLGFLITTIPILPGGVGTGHAAFGFFFDLLGSRQGADAFSFYVLGQLAVGAVGGLIYLRFKSRDPGGSAQLSQSLEPCENDNDSATLSG